MSCIALPSAVPVFGSDDLPDAEIDFLALLIGDGSLTSTTPKLTTASVRSVQFPKAIFRLPRQRLARFLNRLFATDGTAWVAAAGYARIGYALRERATRARRRPRALPVRHSDASSASGR